MLFKTYRLTLLFTVTLAVGDFQYHTRERSPVKVNKCCESYELLIDKRCVHINATNVTSIWKPIFTRENGETNVQVDYM